MINGDGIKKYGIVALLSLCAGSGGGFWSANRELQDHLTRIGKLEDTDESRHVYIIEFQEVQSSLSRIEDDIKDLKKWQAEWPRSGMLFLDQKQNDLIEELRKDVDRLDGR